MENLSLSGFRISPQQKHVFLLQQTSIKPYKVHGVISIKGNLKRELLDSAIQSVIERHEILRTIFPTLPGMSIPLQVITENTIPVINYQDLQNINFEEKEQLTRSLLEEVSEQIFNFEKSPSGQFLILKISPNEHLLTLSYSAIYADTKTIKNLVREVSRFYEAYYNNIDIFDQPLQYVDLAEWQNELFEGEEAELGREYWQNQKFNPKIYPKYLENKTLETNSEFNPQFITVELAEDTVKKLEAIAKTHNISIETLLQSCWQILLYRLTGDSTIVIGTYCEGRNYEELESALGLFAKYLPVKCEFSNGLKFEDILRQIHQTKEEVFKWQDSFTWKETETSINDSFFPFCFEFEQQCPQYSAAGLTFSLAQHYACIDRFKIKLVCTPQTSCRVDNLLTTKARGNRQQAKELRENSTWQDARNQDSLSLQWHYDSSRFSTDGIVQIADRFTTLLEDALKNPQAQLENLEIISPQERQRLLNEFNQTEKDFLPERCIHQLFEQQAARTPDQIAVRFEDQQLTYGELDAKANQLAHYLQDLGVNPETIIGLCVERSLLMVVGMLGILKAGGAYLPLDPQLPRERLTFMLQDAQGDILLTQQSLSKDFVNQVTHLVCLDSDWKQIAQYSDETPTSKVTPENLVYVIYTSGSTGKPKGVMIEHRQLFNYIHGILEHINPIEPTSFATVSTLAADLGNTVIFPALCTGGCLHIISQDRAINPDALSQYCDRYSIDCLKIVPSHLNALLMAAQPEKMLPKKCLFLGGEALSWNLIQKIKQYAPNCQIFNHYGPTETTVGVLTYRVETHSINPNTSTVPLGRPLANTQVYILDDALRPVPMGIPGQVYLAGRGLARGYLNREDLTNERFINNPFQTNSKLYKTGDLARYLPDGNLEFLGRVDHQVKLHGFRIELQEIEAQIRQHSGIQDCVVILREDDPGKPRLVAYIVPEQLNQFSSENLRKFLNSSLPDYMIPAVFVPLKALPLTPNGKIDRQALPLPDSIKPESTTSFVEPRTPIETTLVKIWSEVLGLEQVGIYDNFFELGGDSILSLQITARANAAGLKLSPKQLFELPTIAQLATVTETTSTNQAEQNIVTGSVPLTPIQQWFFEQKLPDSHHWNQAILLEAQHQLDIKILNKAIQKLSQHHDALRLKFTQTETCWRSINTGWTENEQVFCSYIDLSRTSSRTSSPPLSTVETFNQLVNEFQASLDLSKGLLMRVALFNFGENQPQRLLWIIHHLVVDGVSWRVLLEDLQTAYEQLSHGETVKLPAKTTSFKQWAEHLHDLSNSGAFEQEQDYWLNISHQTFPFLPLDYPEGSNTLAEAQTISVGLTQTETQSLLQDVPATYHTQINDVLLTALVQAFADWTGEPRLFLNLEGHGRENINQLDVSRTVGWFTSIFPVLLSLDGISGTGEALKSIKEQLRTIPNQGINYGILRYLSANDSLKASLKNLPQAQVRFNYLGQLDSVMPKTGAFKLLNSSVGCTRSAKGNRLYLIDINGFVLGGELKLDWTYSQQIHQQTTIEQLANGFIEALRSLITHCQASEVRGYTPADFPQANLNQKDLDKLLSKFNLGKGQK